MKKAWNWFNGKKTLIGSILVGVPIIWAELSKMLEAGGVPDATVTAIGGTVLLVVGWGHKILKVLGLVKLPGE